MGRSSLGLIGWVLTTFVAAISGAVTAKTAVAFYASLKKPSWAPPSWLFGPAWSVLYLLMSIAAWTIWRDHGFDGARTELVLYFVQLALNAGWSWFFFVKRDGQQALIEVLFLWTAIVATLIGFWRLSPSAGILFVPYLMWVSFATALTYSVWRRNPDLL
jgi:benzodiazapine receptor